MYQRITLSTRASAGEPGALPAELVGLAAETLANLPAALSPDTIAQLGLQDTGFVLVADRLAPPPRTVARIDFMRRFTPTEQMAVQGAADPVVKNVLFMLGVVDAIDLDNAGVQPASTTLEQAGLIGAGRAAEILA